MAGRGGARLGAGRKRSRSCEPAPPSSHVTLFGRAVMKGLALASLPLLPDGSDSELVEATIAGLVADEIRRGRGGEILRLVGNVAASMGGPSGASSGAESESLLVSALGSLPGADTSGVKPIQPDTGLDVREIQRILKSGEGGGPALPAFGPRQGQLFSVTPGVGVSVD